MKYIRVTVHTNTVGSEIVSEIMWEYSDQGVAIEDKSDVKVLNEMKKGSWDYVEDGLLVASDDVLVRGFIPCENAAVIDEIKERVSALSDLGFEVGTLKVETDEVDGDEWREKWKENFKPIHIGKIVIRPEWINYDLQPGETEIIIDSNTAFGTGEHETTSMCVAALERFVKSGDVVIDVGCGSGILGMVAERIGASKVVMTDIDETAVEAAKHNVELNGIQNAEVLLKNLLDDETVVGNVIVANIMAEVLIGFSEHISKNLKKGGIIILSGILTSKQVEVKEAYLKAGFEYVDTEVNGEWCCEVFKRNE